MIATRSTSPLAPHADYRRRARRIRGVFAKQPALRVRALRELAQVADAKRLEVLPDPIVTLPAGAAQTFADLVRQRMNGPVLRYSHRTRLIREAEQRGIGRFEANLIIAAVQHQAGATRRDVEPVALRAAWMPEAFAFAATQSLIVLAVWWIGG